MPYRAVSELPRQKLSISTATHLRLTTTLAWLILLAMFVMLLASGRIGFDRCLHAFCLGPHTEYL